MSWNQAKNGIFDRMNLSPAEVNYIAAIQKLSIHGSRVSTNALAQEFNIAPASVTDMVQRLSEKELVYYEKYKGVSLLPAGEEVANQANISEAIWVQFFKEKLSMDDFEIEDALEHFRKVQSKTVLKKLKNYLGASLNRISKPRSSVTREKYTQSSLFHQPILPIVEEIQSPNHSPEQLEAKEIGKRSEQNQKETEKQVEKRLTLSQLNKGESCYVLGVEELPSDFLKLLQVHKFVIGTLVRISDCFEFDESIQIELNDQKFIVSKKIAESIMIARA